MISISSPKTLESLCAATHPDWSSEAIQEIIIRFLDRCDPRLEKALEAYTAFGVESDYTYGEFSLSLICALRRGCSFLDAVMLMNEYMLDPLKGKALILRR